MVGVTLVQVVGRVGGGGGVGRGGGAAAKGSVHLILLCYLVHKNPPTVTAFNGLFDAYTLSLMDHSISLMDSRDPSTH